MTNRARRAARGAAFAVLCVAFASACHLEGQHTNEGLEHSGLPEPVREDYALFAQRCSKCHSLARPLQSGISSDEYWEQYVERMRRQPGSGIAPNEVEPILRFLHYYSEQQRTRRSRGADSRAPAERGGGQAINAAQPSEQVPGDNAPFGADAGVLTNAAREPDAS